MKTFRLSAVVVALGLSAAGAMAGQILNTDIYADDVTNRADANTTALQHVGATFGNGEIKDSEINARQADNHATGNGAVAHQDIGVAVGSGRLDNVYVYADNARNRANGANSEATQQIGRATNGLIKDTNIFATNAYNLANGANSTARQQVGVVNP
jgi:hypothetical protein